MRLIDADRLKKHLKQLYYIDFKSKPILPIRVNAVTEGTIDVAPTVNPIRHGYWIDVTREKETTWTFACSICGHMASNLDNYCGGCGAKMEVTKNGRG